MCDEVGVWWGEVEAVWPAEQARCDAGLAALAVLPDAGKSTLTNTVDVEMHCAGNDQATLNRLLRTATTAMPTTSVNNNPITTSRSKL